MPRVTLKSSTIFISVGNKTEVFRSVDDVPPPLRKKLEQSTNSINSATILIADRNGKEEIVRAIAACPPACVRGSPPRCARKAARSRLRPPTAGSLFGKTGLRFCCRPRSAWPYGCYLPQNKLFH
jgi:hypothetical protein